MWNKWPNSSGYNSDSNDLMEKFEANCDTSDLVNLVDKDTMIEDSLTGHEK